MKKYYIIGGVALVAILAAVYFLFFYKNLEQQIVIPYISHQNPRIDPHIPSSVPIADKMDEALFDGLFNVSANPSGLTYEDGLGELMGIDANNVVTVRLKPRQKWHESYQVQRDKDEIQVQKSKEVFFNAEDLNFTLRRIQRLGSLSPDYILVSQAIEGFRFTGPDENNVIEFKFRDERIWTEPDIKEVLSFKVLPASSGMNQPQYKNGSGPYLSAGKEEDIDYYFKNPVSGAHMANLQLAPFIDNSTYTTELKNGNINALLSIPFGSLSPILSDSSDFFYKSNVSTVFFALLFNTERLNLEQRQALRALVDNRKILERFYKIGSPQQRHIADYKGNSDNYNDYLNYSIFPSSSYYVEEKVVLPLKDLGQAALSILPDTVRIQTCLNYGFREELTEIADIMNDPGLFHSKLKVRAVQNDEIKRGNYDAILLPVTGYRSNFLFDLYDIFLREPDFANQKVNLITDSDGRGKRMINFRSFEKDKNFFRIDLGAASPERGNFIKLLEYIYGFMATDEVGDKQAYAQFLDELDQEMALGKWLFSLPSTAYFSTQFDSSSIDLYGVASQLSTIEKWQEKKD